jgi:hypothetical protein
MSIACIVQIFSVNTKYLTLLKCFVHKQQHQTVLFNIKFCKYVEGNAQGVRHMTHFCFGFSMQGGCEGPKVLLFF